MKILARTLLLCMLLLVTALLYAPFTERGSQAAIALLHKYTPLDVRYAGGTLGSILLLERIAYVTDTLKVELLEVESQVNLACLWRSAFCFDSLTVRSLDIAVKPAPADEPGSVTQDDSASDLALFEFPVDLESRRLAVGSVRVRWDGGQWRNGAAVLGVAISGSRVAISDASLDSPVLELSDTGNAQASVKDSVSLPNIDLPLILSIDALHLPRSAWNVYGNRGEVDELRLAGDWRNTRLRLERLEALSSEVGKLSVQGQIDFSGDWPVDADSQVILAQQLEWPDLQGREINVQARGSLAAMQLQLVSEGEPAIEMRAQLAATEPDMPFEAQVDVDWPEDFTLASVAGVPESLQGLVMSGPSRAEASGSLLRQSLVLDALVSGMGYQEMQVSLEAEHSEGQVLFSSLNLRDAAGANELTGQGEWRRGDNDHLELSLESKQFALPDINESVRGQLQGSLKLDLRRSAEQWNILLSSVDISGQVNELPASISGQLQLDQDLRLAGSDLHANVNQAQLRLRGAQLARRSGEVTLKVSDIGLWREGARGALQVDAGLDSSLQQLTYTVNASDLAWGGVSIAAATLSGTQSLGEARDFSFDGTLSELRTGELELAAVTLAGEGAGQQQFELASQGDLQGVLRINGTFANGQWRGSLEPTTLQSAHGNWRLPETVALEWLDASRQVAVESHCWIREQASICPGDALLGSLGSASVEASGDMRYLETLLAAGFKVQGELELQFDAAWGEGVETTVSGSANARDVVVTRRYGDGESASASWESGRANLLYNADGLVLKGTARKEQRDVLSLDLLLPGGAADQLRGKVSIDAMRLEPMIAFLPMLSSLRGELSGEVELQGSADQPLVFGQLQLTDAGLGLVGNPTALENLQVRLELRGERATIAGDGELGGGPVTLRGELGLQPELSLQMTVAGEQQNILYPPATELLASQQLEISAGPGLLSINGDITVHRGSLEPEELPAGSVALSSDVVEIDYTGKPVRERLPFDVVMDVRVKVENKFTVKSSILFATLGGELRLLQRRREPLQLFGSLNVLGGELRAYQQLLKIRRGSFSFTGQPDNPSVNVRAERNISGENVTVGIQVSGSYDALSLQIVSEPPMSEGEAMSYLLRGRGLDSSTGEDGTALALSMASGVVNRTTLVSELNRIPGVSNVSFGADGTADDTAATVSGYLGNRLYLSYGVGVYEPINVLIARFYLRTRLWLEVVSRLENSVDLYYAFDIE